MAMIIIIILLLTRIIVMMMMKKKKQTNERIKLLSYFLAFHKAAWFCSCLRNPEDIVLQVGM